MANQTESIRDVLTEYQANGLFTHAHFLSGRLDASDFTSDVAVCPDLARIFDLSSLTKALCTAPLVYKTLKDRSLDLDSAVLGDLIPEWPTELPDSFKSLHVKSLLRHESGLPAWRNFWLGHLGVGKECRSVADRHSMIVEKFASLAPFSTEKRQVYSDLGFILLGFALEKLSKKSLSELFEESFPLFKTGEAQVHYADKLSTAAVVPSAYCPLRMRLLVGEVHDENCSAMGGVSGHAGLFGNAHGIAKLVRFFYKSDLFRPFLETNANHIIANTPGVKPNDSLFGMRQGSDRSAAGYAEGRGMGHLGFTGTAFWIDWNEKRFAILLTNRVISSRINRAIVDLRSKVFALAK